MIRKDCAKLFFFCLLMIAENVSGAPAAAAAPLADLSRFPQRAEPYLSGEPNEPVISYDNQKIYAAEYLRNHFAPWQYEDLSYLDLDKDKIAAFQKSMAKKSYFNADGVAVPPKTIAAIVASGEGALAVTGRPGIALADADVRVYPSAEALYPSADSARGARGMLRQDALQNSTIKPGEPLRILRYSKNSQWAFIATGSVVGWVRDNRIAAVDADFIDRWMYSDYAVFIRDNVRFAGKGASPAFIAKMGTILPRDGNTLYLPQRSARGFAELRTFKPAGGTASPFPVAFTQRNAIRAAGELMGEPYGWGGASGFRDCSALTRDYFSLFGVWLPRNSGDQAKAGASIPLKNIPAGERSRLIAERGIPFATLIYMPGHIMLYLGIYDGEPVVLHNLWGVRVNTPGGKVGRNVVGRAAVTSLYLGAELDNRPKGSLIIDNVVNLSFPVANIW